MLGIDLRVTSVKVVEVAKTNSGFILKSWGMTEVPYQLIGKHPQLEDAKADALQKLIQTNKIKSREAVVVVGGGETFVKKFTLSELPPAEAAQAIKWKLAEEIPFPIEEAVVDFYPLSRGKAFTEKIDYLAACISRNLYLETKYVLNKANLKLRGITVLPDALQELFKEELAKNGERVTSVIYMGKQTTNISIFRCQNFEFNRELPLGGENISLAMSGILVSPEGKVEISSEEAEKIKIKYGVPVHLETYPKLAEIPLTQLQAMVRPALERIQNEIIRTFEYYKSITGEVKVDKIVLTGGSSQTQHLVEFLSQSLGIPIVTPEPIAKFNPRLAGALGAALVNTRKTNLLPEEVKYRWKRLVRKFLKPQFLVPTFLGLLLLLYLYHWFQAFSLQKELNFISKKLEEYQPRLAQLEVLEKASQEEEKRKLVLKSYEGKKTRIPRIFEEISHIIPQSVNLNVLNLTLTDLHLWGTVFEKGEAAENILSRFVLALSASELFENVQLIQAVKNYDYTTDAFNFEITAKLKEK